MTIDELTAGRELDALVADKVMGRFGPQLKTIEGMRSLPNYSTDIAAAWNVVERILAIEKTKNTYLPVFSVQVAPDGCSAVLQVGMGCLEVMDNASTVPLAICRAALKAVEANRAARVTHKSKHR